VACERVKPTKFQCDISRHKSPSDKWLETSLVPLGGRCLLETDWAYLFIFGIGGFCYGNGGYGFI